MALLVGMAILASGCGMIQVPQGLPFPRGAISAQPSGGPTTPPTPAPRPPASGVLPEPPPYRIIQTESVGDAYRVRYQTDIVTTPEATREELIAALADAVRATFEERPDAEAVVVFAFFRPEAVRKTYDVGRALASRDRRGWRGENSWFPYARLPDRGKIHVTLGSALTEIEEIETDLESLPSPQEGGLLR